MLKVWARSTYVAAPESGTRVQMMSVKVKTGGATLEVSPPTLLFTTRMVPTSVYADYAVTRDGQRFLVGTILDAPTTTRPSSVVVLNWTAELRH